ncbi:hypothetical protein ZOD2009_19043 [Haladaptatus paucihalophilus DX253]|uniref:DUF8053 domain-containing protein n=2 Tax=Haladaptatus paucihalophilus DX253 TaxID=797209 RepID=E7QYB8_HALPU|nr:hypothetical protein ZOD2009_19043 [Haladaptatus paucihalophilus DX253]
MVLKGIFNWYVSLVDEQNTMPFRKLTDIGGTSVGVTIDKSELRADGLIDEDGKAVEQQMLVKRTGPGTWEVKKPNPEEFPALD